jgi:5-dehydro-4-deoxyglucarate dehydratase
MSALDRRQFLKHSALLGVGASTAALGQGNGGDPKGEFSSLSRRLRGVHNFLTTPFLSDYALDATGLEQNVAHHARAGARDIAIVVGGGLGELFTLDSDEQRALAQAAVAGAKGKLPVVVGAGGGYGTALRMARNAEAAGADAVLLFSPPYGSGDPEGSYRYFKDIADAVSIGVILYPRGKEEHWPVTVRRLADVPNILGFKDASGGIEAGRSLGALIPDDFLWIAEGEQHAAKALPAGARAYTSAVSVFVPEACRLFWKYGVAQRLDEMNDVLGEKIDPIVKLRGIRPGYGISAIKVALEALGRAGGPVRPPGTMVLSEDRERIAGIARQYAEPH